MSQTRQDDSEHEGQEKDSWHAWNGRRRCCRVHLRSLLVRHSRLSHESQPHSGTSLACAALSQRFSHVHRGLRRRR
jgi:hypothetical protein